MQKICHHLQLFFQLSPKDQNKIITAVINHVRPSAQKRLDKTLVLVDVNHLHLLADLPEKNLKPCSGPLIKIIILFSVCMAGSLNTQPSQNVPAAGHWPPTMKYLPLTSHLSDLYSGRGCLCCLLL